MSISSINANKFYQEVNDFDKVYTIFDNGGYPAPKNSHGRRVQPFWSDRKLIESIIKSVPGYNDFKIKEITLNEFKEKWINSLKQDNFLIGINWSGENVEGYDLDPEILLKAINHRSK